VNLLGNLLLTLFACRDSTKDLHLEQSEGFRNLDRSIQHNIHSILDGQNAITSEVHRQTDSILGKSAQQHIKTREIIKRNQDQIFEGIHSLRPNVVGLPPESDEDGKFKDRLSNMRATEKLLAALAFEIMRDRDEQIKESYQETFGWIFKDPKSTIRPWSSFKTWLTDPNSSLY
jgi:hypothetical protein